MSDADELYFTADQAAGVLGVSRATLYAYVSRKGIRSERVPGDKARVYWKADVLAAKANKGASPRHEESTGVRTETALTLLAEGGPFYRGVSVFDLADRASVEDVAGLLWGAEPEAIFQDRLPNLPDNYEALLAATGQASAIDRAAVVLPFLEAANPKAFDLSPQGMAATGADAMRCLVSVTLGDAAPSTEPLHAYIGRRLSLDADWTDIVRRLMILSADHGFEAGTYAVRALANTGVSPYRCLVAGLTLASGRRTRYGRFDGLHRLLAEIDASPTPEALVVNRLREGEEVPGFGYPLYPAGDPRAVDLFRRLDRICARDVGYQRLKAAIATVEDLRGLKPDFALVALFINRRLGLDSRQSVFLLGRAIGWIAHAIEQFQDGEMNRPVSVYTGRLPSTPRP